MPEQQVRVTFQPCGRTVVVLPGMKVLEAAARAGLPIDTPCGGAGTCGKCRVRVSGRVAEPAAPERRVLSDEQLRAGWRLACQTAIAHPLVVHVPDTSLFGGQHQILQESRTAAAPEVRPAVRKQYVELPPPTLEDDAPDLLRLERAVGAFKTDLALLRELPARLRACGFKGTAVLSDHQLIDFEPGDTTGKCYGAAFDIGTTTIVGSLLDLRTGSELAIASRLNPQVTFGDDVLSRIRHSGSDPQCLEDLRRAVVTEVVGMIDAVCGQAKVERRCVYEIAFAGNTTMEHLLCGIDPTPLGQIPFSPVHARGLLLPAGELDIPIHPRGMAYVFPVIGGFVGGDTVAGILATRLTALDAPALMVDIGTNGEIVLHHDGQVWAASTAAGPAFEGARISCGMRATTGAVEKVVIDQTVHLGVIGGGRPAGLCGSGLIDLAAGLLDCGIVSADGRLLGGQDLPGGLPEALRGRVIRGQDGQTRFLLADGPRKGDAPLSLTQRDVRELQLASGAIRAGIALLLKRAGLNTSDLRTVLIAGGFGSFIRRSHAQRIGLLPPDIEHTRIHYVGNVSLAGARWALLSVQARQQAEHAARAVRHIELSTDGTFQDAFAEAMIFPSPAPR